MLVPECADTIYRLWPQSIEFAFIFLHPEAASLMAGHCVQPMLYGSNTATRGNVLI
jgi:hypothetical protein